MAEINRQIEMRQKEIEEMEMRNSTAYEEPYSPSRPVTPPLAKPSTSLSSLANITLPSNLADILKSINVTASVQSEGIMSLPSTSTAFGDLAEEYNPTDPIVPFDYVSGAIATTAAIPGGHTPSSKLAQMTDEELLRMVPDDLDLPPPPPAKKGKFEGEPLPPGIEDEEYIP